MLVIVTGLPGTGKTTYARLLANSFDAVHLNTDIIRTHLGLSRQYDAETKKQVYQEMLSQTEQVLKQGGRIVVDGTFYKESLRSPFRLLGDKYYQRMYWVKIQAAEEVVKDWMQKNRQFSEADFQVYHAIKALYEPLKGKQLVLHSAQLSLTEMVERTWQYLDE